MEATYLIKVNEPLLKRILNIGGSMDIIEIETAGDLARFNTIVKAMKLNSAYFIVNKLGLGRQSRKTDIDISDIFVFQNERYYSTAELIDMLTELKVKKMKNELTVETYLDRVDRLMDKVIWNQKHRNNGS